MRKPKALGINVVIEASHGVTDRVFNFSSGPAMLPHEVMVEAQAEFMNYAGSGMSVMEISHRSDLFASIARHAEADLRELLGIEDSYAVLFLSGGATLQFLMVALNLARESEAVAYACTGYWSAKAISQIAKIRPVRVVVNTEANGYTDVPAQSEWLEVKDAAYLHYTPNETIGGVEFPYVPDGRGVPIIADMSSTILSAPIDVSRFGLIYAGAQKNLGPAGLSVVIIRRDLLDRSKHSQVPRILNYHDHAASGSMLNTPPTFNWYMMGKVLSWVRRQGGVETMAELAKNRSRLIYEAIDNSSGFYKSPVAHAVRSRTNIPFLIFDEQLYPIFLNEAAQAGLTQLKGHRSVGGLRASLYNAMPLAGARSLANFMCDFQRRHG